MADLKNKTVAYERNLSLDGCEVSVLVVETGKVNDPQYPTTYHSIFVRVTEAGKEVCCCKAVRPSHTQLTLPVAIKVADALTSEEIFAICEG